MSRFAARTRRRSRRMRAVTNFAAVSAVTAVATLAVFIGITAYASAKSAEIPPPTIRGWYIEQAQASAQASGEDAPSDTTPDGMRTCPATGCSASTCHAETGEMP